ncbi:sigma 54-interacting transcriptional regulator [Methylocella sp.]|uniref:sigma-54-dependent Fis family transcriptional regulator n=1 Tax=Methylocella sp. TaxID=1978226 RepID=UPI00378524E8
MSETGARPRETQRQAATSAAFWRTQEMLLLQHVVALAGKKLAADETFTEMLHLASELLGLNRGRIVLLDDDGGGGSIRYAYGLTKAEIARGRYALDEGVTGRVLARGHLNIVQDIDKEPGFLARAVPRDRLPSGVVSFIALPIQIGQRTVGVLACHRIRRRARMIADDLAILRILATLAGQLLHLKSHIEEKTRVLEQHNAMLKRALNADATRYGIVGDSPELLRAISELERVSDATAAVLLLGESGSGKELFARALHLAGSRRDKPFIKVNCAAIPEALFESELFGHERGAFTGAAAMRAGWFEQADDGTIFLDEIGELPLGMQAKLLRTLQEGALTRLGGKSEIRINVRLVAATNRDLAVEVGRGGFRQDLFYRLNVIPIRLPSLRERRGDIPALALHFLNHVNQANQRNVNLSADAISRLQEHSWPGNIRELSNMIERLVLLADRPSLSATDIEPFFAGGGDPGAPAPAAAPPPDAIALRPYIAATSHSAQQLRQALAQSGGNKSRAAQQLGMTARQFVYRCQKFGI